MLLDKAEIDQLVSQALNGRSAKVYEAKAAETLNNWVGDASKGSLWTAFGPWWPAVQRLILTHYPESLSVRQWNGGQPAPDYLSHYDFDGNHTRNAVAALTYINRNGEYLEHPQTPHSIELASGDRRLYLPGVGLVDEREDSQVEELANE